VRCVIVCIVLRKTVHRASEFARKEVFAVLLSLSVEPTNYSWQ
jgi:hypothetical protein